MGLLTGFNYRQVTKILKRFHFTFDRQVAGSHEVWFNEETNRYTMIPRHPGAIPEGTLKQILEQAGVSIDDFLSKR